MDTLEHDHEFLGTHRRSMDDKGRLVLPAEFREPLKEGLVMTVGIDNCLTVHTAAGWNAARTELRQMKTTNSKQRAFVRMMTSQAQRQTLDKQGRVNIPQRLREYGGLTKECAVVGNDLKIEIWDSDAWDRYEARGLDDLPDSSEELDIPFF